MQSLSARGRTRTIVPIPVSAVTGLSRKEPVPTRISLSYYPWITQSISGSELARAVGDFKTILETELTRQLGNDLQIQLLRELEVPDQLKELATPPGGDLAGKIGLLNPIGYALCNRDHPNVVAIAVIRRKIGDDPAGPTYKAQLYTNRKTEIKKVEQMRGRSMAFGSPQSTSNFLVPAFMLWQQGIHPMNGFSRLEFAGGHDKVAVAVYEGRVDVGAGHDGVISDLADKPGYGDANQILTRVTFSESIPSDPVAAHIPDAGLRAAVAKALLTVAAPNSADSPGNKAVKRFWASEHGFETIAPDAYASLPKLMTPLGLRPHDLLRKL